MALLGVAAACGGQWQRVGTEQQPPTPEQTLTDVFNPNAAFSRMGRLTAGEPLPFVGDIAFAEGPGDSVIGLLGLSMENRALTFQREGDQFVARYRVELQLDRTGEPPIRVNREEIVRVASFQETMRADESILFQQNFHLIPGQYRVTALVSDRASPAQGRATKEYTVPRFEPGTTSGPIIVYQVTGRDSPQQPLAVLLNPRGAVSYGGDTLLAYVEGYGFPRPTRVPFEVRDQQDSVVVSDSLLFQGVNAVESQIVRLAPDSQPLGQITMTVGTGAERRSATALVSFSNAWVLTNYDEMLGLLRYFGEDEWINRLKDAPVEERANLWREFWRETDPNRSTPENEALDAYFSRIQQANRLFRNEGIPGWRTDRGEVFITLGPPDEVFDNSAESQGRFIVWSYTALRLQVFFEDQAGFGRFRLTPSSRADYSRALARVRRQTG